MIKKLVLAVATFVTMGFASAQVDVNKADAAALDGIKGVGPAMSKAILTERAKGEFKDWGDLQTRVKGIGGKKAMKLSEAGMQVNGKPMEAGAARPAKAAKAAATRPAGAKTPEPAKM